jgi:hypothetical protein
MPVVEPSSRPEAAPSEVEAEVAPWGAEVAVAEVPSAAEVEAAAEAPSAVEVAGAEAPLAAAGGALPLEAVPAELPSAVAEVVLSAFLALCASFLPRLEAAAPGRDRTNPSGRRRRCLPLQ